MPECGHAACRKALAPPLLQCSKCKAEAYCCKACQIAAWKAGHKRECGAPGQGVAAAELRRAVREAARIEAARVEAARVEAARAPAPAGRAAGRAMTAQQKRLLARLGELEAARDWRGMVALEREMLALARGLRGVDPGAANTIITGLGFSHRNVGNFARAREVYEQAKAMCEEMGDREGVAVACTNVGMCYYRTEDYGRARELYEQAKAISEALGDREGVATACSGLGLCYSSTGDYGRAREMHEQNMAIVEELGDRAAVAGACGNLGGCYYSTGDYARAREMHEQHKAIAEELGDRGGVARACANLGNCYCATGDYARGREMYEQHRAISEELGDRAGVGLACGNVGTCYYRTGEYGRACALHEQHKAIAGELGDRAGVTMACGNLGVCYDTMGDYGRAREMYEQCKALCEELGDRPGLATACGNLGLCYYSTGDYARACALCDEHKTMAEEMGDRPGVAKACGNLGKCFLNMGEYERAISYFREQHDMAMEIQVVQDQADAALGMGVAHRLELRANVRGRAAGAAELQGRLRALQRANDLREADKWLQTAMGLGHTAARLHLACLAFDAGQEDTALAHLQGYLSWCVENGRNWCAGCLQLRGEDAQMLTCGGCRVAKFCSADHQKMASKSIASGRHLLLGRHKDLCGVLGKWRRQVVKDGMSPDSCSADLLAFLQQ